MIAIAKAKQPLMIPFTYYYDEMLDWYQYYYEKTENNRKITWDTAENHSVWMPQVRSHKYYGESDSDFTAAQIQSQKSLDEYFERLKTGRYIEVDEVVWKPNFEFEDTLKYSHYSRGRSSAKIHFLSQITEKKYEMFLTDFDDLMNTKGFQGDIVSGVFTFCKRGQNYGIKFLHGGISSLKDMLLQLKPIHDTAVANLKNRKES